jgi:hypothetical protein
MELGLDFLNVFFSRSFCVFFGGRRPLPEAGISKKLEINPNGTTGDTPQSH